MKTCEQKGCDKEAVYKMYWPDGKTLLVCEPHKQQAQTIGKVLGLHINCEKLGTVVE